MILAAPLPLGGAAAVLTGPVAVVSTPTAYWYLARGTGVVAMLLLTLTVVLGVLDSQRWASTRWPRFAVDRVHRDVSLLVIVLIVVHILTSVLDGFAPITLLDGVIPFLSPYRPLWLGLGALSFDLLLAVAITSLLRRRLGYTTWRLVHWLAYVSWPVAIFHGLGTGSDIKQAWMLILTAACVLAVVLAAAVRTLRVAPERARLRGVWLALVAAAPVALFIFALVGPLAPHWAVRAGTPVSLIVKAHGTAAAPAGGSGARSVGVAAPADHLQVPFTAQLHGVVRESPASGGALVDLVLHCSGGIHGTMRIRMAGSPIPGGGLSMIGSQVQLTAVGLASAARDVRANHAQVRGVERRRVVGERFLRQLIGLIPMSEVAQLDRPDHGEHAPAGAGPAKPFGRRLSSTRELCGLLVAADAPE